MDFFKKLNLLWVVANQQATNDEARKFVGRPFKAVSAIVPKKGRVRVDDQVWGDKKFEEQYTKMQRLDDDLHKLVGVIKPAPVEGVITWLSALSEPVPLHRPESPGMRKVYQALFSPIPGSKKSDR